jgi:hypothetical protein
LLKTGVCVPCEQTGKLIVDSLQWNSTFFYHFNDYIGHHRKGIAIHTDTEVNLHFKILVLLNRNVFLNNTERYKQANFILNYIIFVTKYLLCSPFQCCPL